jgi:hypothetical protein
LVAHTQVAVAATHTGVSPVQAGWFCQAPLLQRCGVLPWQRASLLAHTQVAVASTHTGVSPEHVVWLCQAPLLQRCGVLPWQRTSLLEHWQLPPEHTGVSPVQAAWFTQAPDWHLCGTGPLHVVLFSLQAQRPVASWHTGVRPEQPVSSCQAPAALQICGELLSRQRRPLPSLGSQATHCPYRHCGAGPSQAACGTHSPLSLQRWGVSPSHCTASSVQRPQLAVAAMQAGVSPVQAVSCSQVVPSALHCSGTSPVQRVASG